MGKKVSVAMCTFNGKDFLRQQIDSILQQSTAVDEIVIGDDGSTDGTQQILEEYQKGFRGLFRVHCHTSKLGTIANFQYVLEQCSGEIIFLCDQDDIWNREKVATMLRRFQDPRCLLLFTDGRLIDPFGTPLGASLWEKWKFTRVRRFLWRWVAGIASFELFNNNKVTGATVAMRRSLLQYSLPIRLPSGLWHDQWFAMHAAARDGLRFMPDRLIDYRVHPKQQVGLQKNISSSDSGGISVGEFVDEFKSKYTARGKLVERIGKYRAFLIRFRSHE